MFGGLFAALTVIFIRHGDPIAATITGSFCMFSYFHGRARDTRRRT
jgi:hypothetical protein